MATYTENLNLIIPALTDKALITIINQNMQTLDAAVGGIHAHIWVRWAAAEPTQDADLKDTPDAWIGIYTGALASAPSAYTAYAWYPCKGAQGERGAPGTGNNWYIGTAIAGTSAIPTAYSTGIPAAQAGDMYLNTGVLPDTGRIYRCTLGGDNNTALWSYAATIRGADGTDGSNGRGIVSIARTSGTGAPGTTDTYTITYSDGTTDTFDIYNGANGTGTGDMQKSAYDTDGDGVVNAANTAGACTGNAVTADKWKNARNIIVKDADGTNAGLPVSVDGSAAVTLPLPAVIKADVTGNATTATKLATARKIMVGGKEISFDGTADINFPLADIGAAAASHAHGGITADGRIGSDADMVVVTGTGGAVTVKTKNALGFAELEGNGKVLPIQASAHPETLNASTTLDASYAGVHIYCTNSSAITLTIADDSNGIWPDDTEIEITMYGEGSVTITAASGVTINSENDKDTISTRNHSAALKHVSANEWHMIGAEE